MQPVEDRERDDTTLCLGRSGHGLFLPEALVWSSLIEEANVLRDEALKMVLSEDGHMVQQFAPQSADKALSESIHVRCPDRGTSDLCADGLEHGREPTAQLGITIDHQHFGVGIQRCISRLLCTPLVGRRWGDGSTDDSAPLEIDAEQDEDGAEERVEGLYEVARPGSVEVTMRAMEGTWGETSAAVRHIREPKRLSPGAPRFLAPVVGVDGRAVQSRARREVLDGVSK